MKKIMGVIAISAALVGFTACGGDDSSDETAVLAGTLAAMVEAKGAAEGVVVDVDCTIKKLATLSAEDLAIMIENIDNPADDATEYGVSEKGEKVENEIIDECATPA